MQRDEVVALLHAIDSHLTKKLPVGEDSDKFELRIIGKSALLLAGLNDSVGTVDIDSLGMDGAGSVETIKRIQEALLTEFGRQRIAINGYYLEFVAPAIVFLPQKPKWVGIDTEYERISVQYLDPHHVIASKLFSGFSTGRGKDKQDVIAALDQALVTLPDVLRVADRIFDYYQMDSRSDRFSDVYKYITKELMPNYGKADLSFEPDDE